MGEYADHADRSIAASRLANRLNDLIAEKHLVKARQFIEFGVDVNFRAGRATTSAI